MMSRFMKASGVQAIGEIPAHWEVIKLKHKYEFTTGFTPPTKNDEYYDSINGLPWATISDLTKEPYLKDTQKKVSKDYIKMTNPTLVRKGSLLYSFKLSVGTKGFAGIDLYTNEAIASFYSADLEFNNYLYYSSMFIESNSNENIYGAKILNQELIKNAKLPFPPLEEQQRIATFLDKKVSHVDNIIEDTKKSMDHLKLYKQSLIIETLTKGLNPNVEMKESGIEWVGLIPIHWEITKIKWLFREINERNKDENAMLLSLFTSIGVRPRNEMEDKGNKSATVLNYKKVEENDLVVNKLLAWMGAIGFSDYEGVTSPDYDVYRAIQGANTFREYYNYYFRDTLFKDDCFKYGRGIMLMRWRTYPEQLKQIPVVNPPLDEQKEIATFLKEKTTHIDSLIEEKEKLLNEFTSYKHSLIYEYVTGKKEVK